MSIYYYRKDLAYGYVFGWLANDQQTAAEFELSNIFLPQKLKYVHVHDCIELILFFNSKS